jgi:hypothetical protein
LLDFIQTEDQQTAIFRQAGNRAGIFVDDRWRQRQIVFFQRHKGFACLHTANHVTHFRSEAITGIRCQ